MNYKWNYEAPDAATAEAEANWPTRWASMPRLENSSSTEASPLCSRRGTSYVRSSRNCMNPFLMDDMQTAVDRLNKAMGRKERIMVYGDYDVDGCTAVALVYKFLQQYYSNVDYYVPNRYKRKAMAFRARA